MLLTKHYSRIKKVLSEYILAEKIEVEISRGVHFAGFRYGHNEYNPYETYIIDLHNKVDEEVRRKKFIGFLQYDRPTNFGEALGITLSKSYPLWQYPWVANIQNSYNA